MDWSTCTPSSVIGPPLPAGRDWSVRDHSEKPAGWHFHIRRGRSHACVTYAVGDSLFEAEVDALEEWVVRWQIALGREDVSIPEIFGCDPPSYCSVPGCDGSCGLLVSVVRLENCRLTEDSPRFPRVVLFDLVVD